MLVSRVVMTVAPAREKRAGLVGWVTCVVGGELRLDGLSVRRTLDGRLIVSFPSRKTRRGVERPYIAPLDDAAREGIQRQILAALDLDERVKP